MPSVIKNIPVFLGRLLIWRAMFYVSATLSSATLSALSGMNRSQADPQTKFMVVLGIFGTVAGTLGAFIDTTAQRVAKGEAPFVDVPLSSDSNPPMPGTVQKTVTAQVKTETTTTP